VPILTLKRLIGFETGVSLQLGSTITKGLGAGANPEVGRDSALEDQEKITSYLLVRTCFYHGWYGWVEQVRVLHLLSAKVARELGI